MDLATILLTSFALSLDCLAVALAAGISTGEGRLREAGRIAFAFGSFQTGMPVLGWLAGEAVLSFISGFDHWMAFFLLGLVGARMIREGISGQEGPLWLDSGSLLVLSVATSIDALAVGVSFAVVGTGILVPCLVIGSFTFAVSFFGAVIGGAAAGKWGEAMEVLGGVVLIGIGIRVILGHLAG